MGDDIEFKGRFGYLNLAIRPDSIADPKRTTKYDLFLNSLEDLTILLNMNPEETVIVGDEKIPYSRFKDEVLERVHRIYPIKDGRLLDQIASADIPGALEKLAKM